MTHVSFFVLDYSDTKIFRILNSELADTLGNLLSRACAKSVNVHHIKPKFHYDKFKELSQMAVLQKLIDLLDALPGITIFKMLVSFYYN